MPGRLAVSTRRPGASESRIIGGEPQKLPETGRIAMIEKARSDPPSEKTVV